MNIDNKNTETKQCTIPSVSGSAFPNGKKRLPKGKYKYVCGYELKDGSVVYHCDIRKLKWSAYFDSEHKAAKMVDLKLIEKGLEPVNVLKRK